MVARILRALGSARKKKVPKRKLAKLGAMFQESVENSRAIPGQIKEYVGVSGPKGGRQKKIRGGFAFPEIPYLSWEKKTRREVKWRRVGALLNVGGRILQPRSGRRGAGERRGWRVVERAKQRRQKTGLSPKARKVKAGAGSRGVRSSEGGGGFWGVGGCWGGGGWGGGGGGWLLD